MKRMLRIWIVVFCMGTPLFLMNPVVLFSQTATNKSDDPNSSRDAYNKAIAKIESAYANSAQTQPTAYLNDLYKLQQAKQKAGDLDGFTIIGKEIDRLKAEQTVPKETDASTPDDIKQLQAKYYEALAKLSLDRDKKILSATTQYVDLLAKRQKNLTIAGKIDDAMAVNAEIKSLQANPKFTSAQFAVAADETERKSAATAKSSATTKSIETAKPQPPKPEDSKIKTGGEVAAASSGTTKSREMYTDDVKIFEGQPFPAAAGRSYKNIPLIATDRISGGQKISATAMLNTESDMEKRTAHWYSSTERWKEGTISYSLRFSVKSAVKSFALDDPTVVVQYYQKSAADQGKISPKVCDTTTFSMPRIDGTRVINVECAAVSLESSSYKLVGRRYSESSQTGSELYGFVISVFDSNGTLVFQGASNNTLKKFGTATIPE